MPLWFDICPLAGDDGYTPLPIFTPDGSLQFLINGQLTTPVCLINVGSWPVYPVTASSQNVLIGQSTYWQSGSTVHASFSGIIESLVPPPPTPTNSSNLTVSLSSTLTTTSTTTTPGDLLSLSVPDAPSTSLSSAPLCQGTYSYAIHQFALTLCQQVSHTFSCFLPLVDNFYLPTSFVINCSYMISPPSTTTTTTS